MMLKRLWKRLIQLCTRKIVYVEVIKEVEVTKEVQIPVYEYGVSYECLADLEKRFPRLMYVKGQTSIEDFAQNAGAWRVILHLKKQLDKQNPLANQIRE